MNRSICTPVVRAAIMLGSLAYGMPSAFAEAGSPLVTVDETSEAGLHLVFELPGYEVETQRIDGTPFHTIRIPGDRLEGAAGAPGLPAYTRYVVLPGQTGAEVSVLSRVAETSGGYNILPAPEGENDRFLPDEELYSSDIFLGGMPVSAGAPVVMRGVRMVPITIRPVQFNPRRGEIRVTRRMEVALTFSGSDPRAAPRGGSRIGGIRAATQLRGLGPRPPARQPA